MKPNVLYLSFCIIAFISFRATAQQFDPLVINDTTTVPVLEETPSFHHYNFQNKQRLDALENLVPLTYTESVQKYIDIYSTRKDQFGKMLGLSSYYFPIFEEALEAYNIPKEIKYLSIIESNLNPHAVSRVGATGIWQFMFGTAKGYGLQMDNYVDERKDPVKASYAAAAYFRDAYESLGDWLLAIAAYNCGRGNVDRAIAKAGSRDFWEIRPFLPLETRNYVPAFIAAIYVMNHADQHQINAQRSEMVMDTDVLTVNSFVSLPLLAQALGIDEALLCRMNPSFKRKIVNGTVDKPKHVIMPRQTNGDFAMVYEVLNNSSAADHPTVMLAANDDRRLSKPGKHTSKSVKYHRVSAGQNLSVIANRYDINVQDIKAWNKLKSGVLVPGQRLIVSKQAAISSTSGQKVSKQYISYKGKALSNTQSDKI